MTATAAAPATTLDRWEMVVGLEVHVQLKTTTKIFCKCSTDFGSPPNASMFWRTQRRPSTMSRTPLFPAPAYASPAPSSRKRKPRRPKR